VLQYISGFIHIYAHRHRHAVTYTNIHGYEYRQRLITQISLYIYETLPTFTTPSKMKIKTMYSHTHT